jgi:nucleotide-binding universal stress UspA family protein/nitrite reductase/ring-hydroxylating ferredoxin subunit
VDVTYKRIVFGTDGSARATAAGDIAAALAKANKAELVIAHIYSRPDGAERVASAALEAAEAAGVKPNRLATEVSGGSAAEELVRIALQRDAGLIVISGGRGQRYALGQVAYRLSHASPCDLLIVSDREHGEGVYKRIVIATDGSATADRAARKGYDLADALGCSVTMAFVGHPATGEIITKDTIATFAGDVPTEVVLRKGDPAEEILAAAEESSADLVIVGNKGMTGAKRFLTASVPQKVSEYAPLDVLVCRTIVQAVSEIGPGEGGIIERQGEKLAAFMDPSGELHLMSSKCTHLGCTVAWNPGESTFDCPCHGSRYAPTGEVVNGPATRALPPA